MKKEQEIQLLTKLVEKSKEIINANYKTQAFKDWKISVERALFKLCGETSIELREFKKLKFYDPKFSEFPTSMQNEEVYKKDFTIAMSLIKQLLEEAKIEIEPSNPVPVVNVQTKSPVDLPKIQWKGTQKQLGELFVELKNKGWIESIDKDSISKHFTNANTISEILKPAADKSGQPTYEKIYTKAYKRSFNNISLNEKNINN